MLPRWKHSLVNEAVPAMAENQWCLTTLEPGIDLAMLLLTLVTATRRLAVAGRGTATLPDALVVGAFVVREAGEDGCAPCLHRQRSKEGDETGRLRGDVNSRSAASRRLGNW